MICNNKATIISISNEFIVNALLDYKILECQCQKTVVSSWMYFNTFLCVVVFICWLEWRACRCRPAGILAVAQRPGPSKPNLPLPPISGLGWPHCRQRLPAGAALPGSQRWGAELRDQPLHQSPHRRMLCELPQAVSKLISEQEIAIIIKYKLT